MLTSEHSSSDPIFTDHTDLRIVDRAPLSVFAIVGLVAGLLSPLAMINQFLWLVPGFALLINALTLMHIERASGTRRGAGIAIAGLVLSLVFLVAAPTRLFVRHWHIGKRADQVGKTWINYLIQNEPYKAYALTQSMQERPMLDTGLQEYYESDPKMHRGFERFAKRIDVVRSLLNIGSSSGGRRGVSVRLHDREEFVEAKSRDWITNVYAIEHNDADGSRATYYVRLQISRDANDVKTIGFWRVLTFRGNGNLSEL